MMHHLRLLSIMLALLIALVGCNGEGGTENVPSAPAPTTNIVATPAVAAPTPTVADTSIPASPTNSTTTTTAPATTSPTTSAAPLVTTSPGSETTAATPMETPAAAGPATGQSQQLMSEWQGAIGVAVLDQSLCTALQGLSQTAQSGGLGGLAATAGLMGAAPILGSAQQQLGGLLAMPGLSGVTGALQADQAALGSVMNQWTGGQLDAAGAGAALQPICSGMDGTLGQVQGAAQTAGLSPEQIGVLVGQSQGAAAGLVGGLNP